MKSRNEVEVLSGINNKQATCSVDGIVDEYRIGNTTIKICNAAYEYKTSEDIRGIMERITRVGWKCIYSARSAGKEI